MNISGSKTGVNIEVSHLKRQRGGDLDTLTGIDALVTLMYNDATNAKEDTATLEDEMALLKYKIVDTVRELMRAGEAMVELSVDEAQRLGELCSFYAPLAPEGICDRQQAISIGQQILGCIPEKVS